MADDKFTEKDLDRLNKAFKDNNDKVETLYDKLVDVFDISGKISAKYANVSKEIEKQNSELNMSKQLVLDYQAEIIQNVKEYKDLGKELVSNNKQLKILEAQENQNKLILEEKKELLREEFRTKQQIAGFEAALLESKNEQARVSEALSKIDDRLKESAQNILAPAGEYNRILEEKRQLLDRENELTTDITKNNELLNNKKKYQSDISDALISGATEYNRAEKENADIAMAINGIKEKNLDINLRQKEINQRNVDLQKGIVDEEEHQYQITKKIFELKAKLNFWQLVKMAYDRFVDLDKAAENFRKTTGFTNTQMEELRKNVEAVNKDFAVFGVSIEKAYDAAQALTDVFGRTTLLTEDLVGNVALLAANLGVAETDSANVLANFTGLGGMTQEVAMNVIKVGAGLSEKAGIPFKMVMQDIANVSEQTTSLLGANPSKLLKSAIAARALGTDLNKIVGSQRRLLDYSSSINDELEASALLGRSISFQKARQLAYEGDIEGAAKATLDAVKKAGNFDRMTVYQREALARASGMELKDLTKMMAVEKQREEIELNGTEEQKKKLRAQEEALKKLREERDLTKKSLIDENEKVLMQERMQGLMTKMKNLMESIMVVAGDILEPLITPLIEILIPSMKVLASLAKLILWPFKALTETIKIGIKYTSEIASQWGWVKSLVETIGNFMDKINKKTKSIFGEAKDGEMSLSKGVGAALGIGMIGYMLFGKGGPLGLLKLIAKPFTFAAGKMASMFTKVPGVGKLGEKISEKISSSRVGNIFKGKATEAVSTVADKTKSVKSGTGIKDFLENLASGLKEMGNGKVFLGAANLVLAAPGLVLIAPAALLASVLGVTGPLLEKGLQSLSIGLGYMGDKKVFMGALGLAAVGASLIPFAFAAKQFTDVDWGSVWKGIGTLAALAAAAFGLSFIAPAILIGSAAIAALGLSLIPLGLAAMVAGKGVEFLSERIKTSIDPIIRLSEISLTKTALGITALSAALSSFGAGTAAAGLGSFVGGLLGGDPIKKMQNLASVGDKLKVTAESIEQISKAMSSFSTIDNFAKSINGLTDSLEQLNEAIDDLNVVKLAAISALSAAGSKAETKTSISTTATDMTGLEAKLDKLTNLLVGGAVRVYLDGKDVSSAISGIGR